MNNLEQNSGLSAGRPHFQPAEVYLFVSWALLVRFNSIQFIVTAYSTSQAQCNAECSPKLDLTCLSSALDSCETLGHFCLSVSKHNTENCWINSMAVPDLSCFSSHFEARGPFVSPSASAGICLNLVLGATVHLLCCASALSLTVT